MNRSLFTRIVRDLSANCPYFQEGCDAVGKANISALKRPKAFDGQPTRIRDGFESDDDFVAELEPKRRKVDLNRAADGAKEAAAAASLGSENLIEVIKGSGKQIPQVVKLWVEQYEKDSKPAMAELLTMLFEACGATKIQTIQGDLLDETNTDDVVVALVNMAAQNGRKFSTPTRVYRQVASLVGLQMVTSFIGVAKMLGDQRQTMQTQLTAEKKKTSDGPHIELLNKRLSETHEKITMIEEMMRKIFTRLFVNRYRDIDPDIRKSCIQSLGAWIVSYPSLFLQDLYLKYLGWALDDKSAGVTKASILALQAVYDVDDNVPSLGPFTLSFYKRMLDLADDNVISVAECAISLVKQLLRHQLLPDFVLGSSTLASAKLRALRTSREKNRRQAWENLRI
ncbi:sister-chromatid cohesion protein 3 [Tanacetum coccineum]|uniref:Sister-chromatid cohesion protein 3 n=1 Tax=Tanacetum coccineum TaxID=301880 RepID=A0ABQ5E4R8_9ASTR